MRVKRYVASSIEEAMSRIKTEMGINAIILHTRYFKEGGFLGFFKKTYVEVTAASEEADHKIQEKITPSAAPKLSHLAPHSYGLTKPAPAGIPKCSEEVSYTDSMASAPPGQNNPARRAVLSGSGLNYELSEMKSLMTEMSQIIEDNSQVAHYPRIGQSLFLRLKRQEVEEKIAKKIVKSTLQQLALNPQVNEEQVENIFMSNLIKLLKKSKPILMGNTYQKKPRIFSLVGPTGVGKTTTIAKLAALLSIMEHKRVAFITVDTYRIAAVEQLKTIAEIMDVPISVVYSVAQLRDCLQEYADKDAIFIDTAGRSHKNAQQLEELKVYLDIASPDEIFLVLASTGKYQDLLDILEAYRDFNISRLIFTKLDETSFYGSIYNIACRSKIPLSYFTNGQNIPDDIEVADPVKLVQLLVKE